VGEGSGMVRMVSMKPWMRMLRWTWNGCNEDGGSALLGEGEASGVCARTREGEGLSGEIELRLLPLEADREGSLAAGD
jgi:hypothetical protein